MKNNQNEKQAHFRQWKSGKKWLYSATALAVLVGGIALNQVSPLVPQITQVSADIVNGTQIGELNGKPVVKAQSNDMTSASFQGTVDGLLASANLDGVRYVADNISWQSNTTLYNGKALSSFGDSARFTLGQDGFQPSDLAIHVDYDQFFFVQNVGTITDTTTGAKIPVSMKVINNGLEHGNDGQTNNDAIFAVRNEGSTVTIGSVTPVTGTDTGGGQSENGGGSGGSVGDGSLVGYLNKNRTTVSLVRTDNGQEIPDTELLVAMKVSDVDANQLIEVGGNGALGYIVSPDTALSVSGNGLRSTSNGATIEDSPLLTSNSYVVLKRFNRSLVDITYLDGAGDHKDLVWALFGYLPFKINVNGTFKLDKSLLNYGDTMPNNLYSFSPIVFDIYDKNNKDVGDMVIPVNGSAVESPKLPPGDYIVKERENSVTSVTGQTHNTKEYKVTVIAGKTGNDAPIVKVDNKAVMGEITIIKTGVESGDKVWNENYTLEGNEFKLTSLTDSKTYTGKTDKTGKVIFKNLPLGDYLPEETKASNGFVNTFKPVKVTLTWKDNKTEIVYGSTSGTNQEVKGENELLKLDKETGTTTPQGKAELKGAEYMLVYDDESTGSSPHKKGDPVKWTDKPAPKLISGTKVTESVINGKLIKHGDNVVVKIDDVKFNLNIGNLSAGKYRYKEINVPIGHVTDDSNLAFEVKKKDDKTANIITPQNKSLEQVIKIKLLIQKKVEIAGESADSGYNDIKINVTPREGTNADPQTITTGILNDEDGYANFEGVYGDYVITEDPSTLPKGTELFEPIYLHVDTDPETDKITLQATYKAYADEEGAVPLSGRQYAQSDNETDKNENLTGTVAGAVSSKVPFISLSKIVLTDKAKPVDPETPSIDVEKSSEKIPQAGQGNNLDDPNNIGLGDADTLETAIKLDDKAQTMYFRLTNNGTEPLIDIEPSDKTIIGNKLVKDIKYTYQGKALTLNKSGVLELGGKIFELPVDGYIEATGQLEKLADGETHEDEITVKAKGKNSGKTVSDKDKWYGVKEKPKTPETPITPAKPSLPMTGEQATKLATIIGSLIVAVIAFIKHKVIIEALASIKAKVKK